MEQTTGFLPILKAVFPDLVFPFQVGLVWARDNPHNRYTERAFCGCLDTAAKILEAVKDRDAFVFTCDFSGWEPHWSYAVIADLDSAEQRRKADLLPPPSYVLNSSPGHHIYAWWINPCDLDVGGKLQNQITDFIGQVNPKTYRGMIRLPTQNLYRQFKPILAHFSTKRYDAAYLQETINGKNGC